MKRRCEPELIDLGPDHYTPEEYRDCLAQFGRVGKLLGGNRATERALSQIQGPIESILDIGCGGGQAAAQLAQRYPKAEVVAIDLSKEAIHYAKSHYPLPNLHFELQQSKTLDYPAKRFDLIHCSLVCHHMSWQELIAFIRQVSQISKKALLINDLERSRLAWLLYAATAPLLFHNRLITHDGLLSIQKGFTEEDWRRLEKEAALPNSRWKVTRHFPFRWTVTIENQ